MEATVFQKIWKIQGNFTFANMRKNGTKNKIMNMVTLNGYLRLNF